jgi:hypothetical protein
MKIFLKKKKVVAFLLASFYLLFFFSFVTAELYRSLSGLNIKCTRATAGHQRQKEGMKIKKSRLHIFSLSLALLPLNFVDVAPGDH